MSIQIPISASSTFQTVGVASAQFSAAMAINQQPGFALWLFVSNTACWVAQGANPTASAGAGSMFVPPNVPMIVDGTNGAKLAVIQDAAGGKASLTPLLSPNR